MLGAGGGGGYTRTLYPHEKVEQRLSGREGSGRKPKTQKQKKAHCETNLKKSGIATTQNAKT